MTQSALEELFAFQATAAGLPPFEREYRFHPTRKWRFDFAWPDRKVACEIEGGAWSNGRHTRGPGFVADCEKYNSANGFGWHVYRFTADMLNNTDPEKNAIEMVRKALEAE